MKKAKRVGRPQKKESDKKVQVISYIPKKNAASFKKAISPMVEQFSMV